MSELLVDVVKSVNRRAFRDDGKVPSSPDTARLSLIVTLCLFLVLNNKLSATICCLESAVEVDNEQPDLQLCHASIAHRPTAAWHVRVLPSSNRGVS